MAKLKPYLVVRPTFVTTEEKEELENKKISPQNYKMMSDLAILQNRKLC